MIDNHKPLNLNSTQYNVGEEVLIRRKSRIGKIAPKRRHVLPRKVIGRHLNPSMYKVEFAQPNSHEQKKRWISVKDIASISCNEKEKRDKQGRTRKQRKDITFL